MTKYKITCLFQADWNNIYTAIFGEAVHSYSETNCESPNIAVFGFDEPVTPADLGPLVKIEIIQ